jgi:hypothetical protein
MAYPSVIAGRHRLATDSCLESCAVLAARFGVSVPETPPAFIRDKAMRAAMAQESMAKFLDSLLAAIDAQAVTTSSI